MTVTILARVVRGLEWVTAAEVAALLPETNPRLAAREVSFEVPRWPEARLLGLRTVDDAFLRVDELTGVGGTKDVPARVAGWAAGLDWATWRQRLAGLRSLPPRPRFDVVASLDGRRNFNRFALENAVGAAVERRLGAAFAPRDAAGRAPGETQLTVRLMLRGERLVIALRLGERPLHRRAYKRATGAGTLHPPLAAAMARLAVPSPAVPFPAGLVGPAVTGSAGVAPVAADPFCGDGTLAIEAALASPPALTLAGDLDPARLVNARANAARAGVRIGFVRADAGRPPWRPGRIRTLLTNPPWEQAVRAQGSLSGSLRPFLRAVPRLLSPDGRACLLLDAELDGPDLLARRGLDVLLAQRIRLAGRLSDLVLCAPAAVADGTAGLPAELARWRERALAGDLLTADGFR